MKKETIEQLEEKFKPSQIKKRPGSFGKTLDYVEGPVVIQRLNKAFNHNWSFHILKQDLIEGYFITHGQICTKDENGNDICKTGVGGKLLAKKRDGSGYLDVGNDAKASSVDALKKAATLFGVALDLYGINDEVDEKEESVEAPKEDGPIKLSQVSAITKIAGDKLKGILEGLKVDSLDKLSESAAKRIIIQLNEKK